MVKPPGCEEGGIRGDEQVRWEHPSLPHGTSAPWSLCPRLASGSPFLQSGAVIFCEKALELSAVLLLVAQQGNAYVLGNVINPIAELNDFLILSNRGILCVENP